MKENYKLHIQVWLDVIEIAGIISAMQKAGMYSPRPSDIIRFCINTTAKSVIFDDFKSPQDALHYLETKGFKLRTDERTFKVIAKVSNRDTLEEKLAETIRSSPSTPEDIKRMLTEGAFNLEKEKKDG